MQWWRKLPRVRTRTVLLLALLLVGTTLVVKFLVPLADSVQRGARGTAMVQVYDPKALAAQAANNEMPPIAPLARVRANAPKAGASYKNVRVLGELTLGEFGRTMNSITAWVAPGQSCAYCHVDGDFSADDKYTKVVARRMLQMVQNVNTRWSAHVGSTGVTCYTCHRGNNLPQQVWFRTPAARPGSGLLGDRAGQNAPAPAVGYAALPGDPFSAYLESPGAALPVRVAGTTALPTGNRHSVKQAEFTYGLMTHMSRSLGVNCTYCHNSRSFSSWEQSSPQRVTAWYGLRMVREVNHDYLDPLTTTFPAVPVGRLGPTGDSAKVNCATCHQGAFKPLYGAQMAKHYPAMWQAAAGSAPVIAMELVPASAPLPALPASAPEPAVAEPAAATPPASAASSTELMARATGLPGTCAAASELARQQALQVNGARMVTGRGRLQFFQAPDARCVMAGVFILGGEPVAAVAEHQGYTAVRYRHPRTGVETTGWVISTRVAPAPQAAAPTASMPR